MKKLCSTFLGIILATISLFPFTSCKSYENTASNSESSSVEKYEPIKELLLAIKKNPTEYNNKEVTIKGTFLEENGETVLLDYHQKKAVDSDEITGSVRFGVEERHQARQKTKITVVLKKEVSSYVIDSWDYIEVTGTVKITEAGIYLDDCQCRVL